MTNTEQLFEKHELEYLETSKAKLEYSDRPDLNAFIMLDKLDGSGDRDIVVHAEHDQIYLDVSDETIENLTEQQVLELLYCGVSYRFNGLHMFV